MLTKLMDAQLKNPAPPVKPTPKARKKPEDPVKQMKRIKRVERKFNLDEKRAKMAKNQTESGEPDGEKLPGKKLNIWKKRDNTPSTSNFDDKSQNYIECAVNPAYSAQKSYKIGAKTREMQNERNFERVRGQDEEAEENSMTVEEMGEFMAEQRKKLDFDMDEYYNDNDAGYENDDYVGEHTEDIDQKSPRPILKTPESANLSRKSVRFSLKPSKSAETPPKKRARMEEILEAFDDDPDKGPLDRKIVVKSSEAIPDQAQVVQELLKKFPNILKDNKQVKVKVMVKDADGKSTMKMITLKAAEQTPIPTEPVNEPVNYNDETPVLKLPTVMYTGIRGRPKKIKAEQPTLNQVEANNDDNEIQSVDKMQLSDPSSEAESLSNVVSGIATSLGVAVAKHSVNETRVTSEELAKDWDE